MKLPLAYARYWEVNSSVETSLELGAEVMSSHPLLSVIVTSPTIVVVVFAVSVIADPPFKVAELATGTEFVTEAEDDASAAMTKEATKITAAETKIKNNPNIVMERPCFFIFSPS